MQENVNNSSTGVVVSDRKHSLPSLTAAKVALVAEFQHLHLPNRKVLIAAHSGLRHTRMACTACTCTCRRGAATDDGD
jgi:hypothetical protein